MQTLLDMMTGQPDKVLLALDTRPDDNEGVANNDHTNTNADDTYARYYKNQEESVASVLHNNPSFYEDSAILVLDRGETCLWKSGSLLFFHVVVVSTTFQQASNNLHNKIILASEGTYMDSVKHSELFIDPVSETKSTADSIPLLAGITHLLPVPGVQAIRRVAAHPIIFEYGDVTLTLTTSHTACQVGNTVYWHHHSNLIQQAQIMRAVMPSNPDEPIVYDVMGLNDAALRAHNVPHHDCYLDATTPTYDPSTLAPEEAPLTAA